MMWFLWLVLGFLVGICVVLEVQARRIERLLRESDEEDYPLEHPIQDEADIAVDRLVDWTPGSFTNIADGLKRIEERNDVEI